MDYSNKKLIIWDFDGVIADTEILWMENRRQLLKKYFNLDWDLAKVNTLIGGMSWKTRLDVLQNMGISVTKKFEEEGTVLDLAVLEKGICLTPGIEQIFALKDIKQCIATGGTAEKTAKKLSAVGIDKIFSPDKVFVAEMISAGKPAPDLFLLAAEKMGENPEDCLVIEDSLAGIKAAQNAKMDVVAFVGSKMNNNQKYISQIQSLGVVNIFDDMEKLKTCFEKRS